jgi:hypothetical protein
MSRALQLCDVFSRCAARGWGDVNHPHAFPQPQGAATVAIEDEVMALTPWEIANILRKSTVSPFTTCEESSTIVDKCVTQP